VSKLAAFRRLMLFIGAIVSANMSVFNTRFRLANRKLTNVNVAFAMEYSPMKRNNDIAINDRFSVLPRRHSAKY